MLSHWRANPSRVSDRKAKNCDLAIYIPPLSPRLPFHPLPFRLCLHLFLSISSSLYPSAPSLSLATAGRAL
jgi:hypothetical protein